MGKYVFPCTRLHIGQGWVFLRAPDPLEKASNCPKGQLRVPSPVPFYETLGYGIFMKKVTPTAARIVKKSLWKDINRWIEEEYNAERLEIDVHKKRKRLRSMLEMSKKNDGTFYAGAILLEEDRLPSRNKLIILTWDA
jgi:hypothetical protein